MVDSLLAHYLYNLTCWYKGGSALVQNWLWTSLLLVWMADFWVSSSPPGQFLASAHSAHRVPLNNNHMQGWPSFCVCVCVSECARQTHGDGGKSSQNPGGCDVRRFWGRVWSWWVIATCWETRLVWIGPHVFSTARRRRRRKKTSPYNNRQSNSLQRKHFVGKMENVITLEGKAVKNKRLFFNIWASVVDSTTGTTPGSAGVRKTEQRIEIERYSG